MKVTCRKQNLIATALFAALAISAVPAFSQSSADKAWSTLQKGIAAKDSEKAIAVRVLGMIENNGRAAELALNALKDEAPEVRSAAAAALGHMNAKSAVPRLQELAKSDKEASVVMAAARSLIALGDPLGYSVYYAVLTGEKKTGGGLLDEQKQMLKDPKKMAQFGFEQGIGFVPFGGVSLGVVKAVRKDDTSPVRAAAAKILAKDSDPKTTQALVQATGDKNWLVRAAALDALSHRGDAGVLPQIEPRLDDENEVVRYTAAAAVIHLHDLQTAKAGR